MGMVGCTLQLLGIFVFYHTIWFDGLTYARQIQDYSGIMETLNEMDNIQRSEDNILHEIKRKQHKKQSTSFEGNVGELRVKADNILREMDKQSKNKGISQEKKVMKKIQGWLDYLLSLGNSGSPSLSPIDKISDALLSLGNSGSNSLSPIDMISDDLLSLGNNGSPSWSPINIISGMQGMKNGEIVFESSEMIEEADIGENFKAESNLKDSSGTCDFTQFGSNHSAVLPPKEKCEKFRMIAGEIYKRGVSEEDIQAILKTHNELRSTVAKGLETRGNPGPQPSGANLRELIWNEQLAVSAQGWADQCAVKHDLKSNRQTCEYKIVGQNCAHKKSKDNKPSTVQWEKIINNLHNEVVYMPNYAVDQQQKPPKGQTGHYTQVVWAKTYEVGCGVVSYYLYKEVKGKLEQKTAKSFVCNYGPPGNYRGAKVYERGPPASKCDNGVSANYPNLCAPPAT